MRSLNSEKKRSIDQIHSQKAAEKLLQKQKNSIIFISTPEINAEITRRRNDTKVYKEINPW